MTNVKDDGEVLCYSFLLQVRKSFLAKDKLSGITFFFLLPIFLGYSFSYELLTIEEKLET